MLASSYSSDDNRSQIAEGSFVSLQNPHSVIIKAGETISNTLTFRIATGYYIMADRGKQNAALYTTLTMLRHSDITFGSLGFSNPAKHVMPGETEEFEVFENTLEVTMPIMVDRDATYGVHLVVGILRYQATDSTQGYFPKELRFQFPIYVV